jgi:hypothetical protein
MKIKLPSGTNGFWNDETPSRYVGTGSQMGRRNTLPADLPNGDWEPGTKLRLLKLAFVDNCYDQGGAYWGAPENIYIATEGAKTYSPALPGFELVPCGVTVFVRANSRQQARQAVQKLVPDAKFFR